VDVTLVIDGLPVTAGEGASLLEVARSAGCAVPGLCHHEALSAIASCRLCLVEVRRPGHDRAQLTTSCDYPVSEGLVVTTDSEEIRRHRRMNLQLLRRRAPRAPALLQLAEQLGAGEALFEPLSGAPLPDCILCELCVRTCAMLGYNALSVLGRGDHKHVGAPFGQTVARACVGCGSCVEVCPTGCIAMEETATTRTVWGRTHELVPCGGCGAPLMTSAQLAATAARGGLSRERYDLCETCRRAALSEGLASGARG